jgi:hypothetical protein
MSIYICALRVVIARIHMPCVRDTLVFMHHHLLPMQDAYSIRMPTASKIPMGSSPKQAYQPIPLRD